MSEIKSYRDLKVWQDVMTLTEGCYRLSNGFAKEELFGLTSRLRQAAVSIPANIAGRKLRGRIRSVQGPEGE